MSCSYLVVQHHSGLALVPGTAQAPCQNLCSSTSLSWLSRKKHWHQKQFKHEQHQNTYCTAGTSGLLLNCAVCQTWVWDKKRLQTFSISSEKSTDCNDNCWNEMAKSQCNELITFSPCSTATVLRRSGPFYHGFMKNFLRQQYTINHYIPLIFDLSYPNK